MKGQLSKRENKVNFGTVSRSCFGTKRGEKQQRLVTHSSLESLNLSALHVQLSHQLASPNATESGAQNFDDHLVTPTLF